MIFRMSVPLPTPCHCVIRTRPSFDRFFAVLTTLPEKKASPPSVLWLGSGVCGYIYMSPFLVLTEQQPTTFWILRS